MIFAISSLFCFNGIYAIFSDNAILTNILTIEQKTTYTVMYQQQELDLETFTTVKTETGETRLGNSVTPTVYPYEGFISPPSQTVVVDTYDTVIIYKYYRKTYLLTINDSSNVVTSTPSGRYYYGTSIHLVANEYDSLGQPFAKWSNEVTNRDYTFTLTEDTTIGPIYANSHTVTLVHNNGEANTTINVVENQPITSFPELEYNDCVGSTGSYQDRQCTYYYKFRGWYKEPTFVNQVREDFVPTEDITLYAKWDKVYYGKYGTTNFDGTQNTFIDTGINLFSQDNASKDFIVTFTVDSNNGYNSSSGERGTIFTNMKETGEPYSGVQFFTEGNNSYAMNVNIAGNKKRDYNTGYITGQKVVIKKINGYVYYSYDDGPDVLINNFNGYNDYLNKNATFGGGYNSQNNPYRFFIGTLSDMSVEIIDPASYTIHYDANGGTGLMPDQEIKVTETAHLTTNTFTKSQASFGGWNTEPDGSGTSYSNSEVVTGIGSKDEVITLYAQWIPIQHYYVHFDANGGTGNMPDQEFDIDGAPAALSQYAFTRTGYIFKEWNTAQDGSGIAYKDEELVTNLTTVPNGVVNLYAQYRRIAYEHSGDAVFNGTSSTFINTGVNVFDNTNFNKDFEIRFTFKSVDSDQFTYTTKQPTIFNVKDETNPYMPGFNIRFNQTNVTNMTPTYKWAGNTNNSTNMSNIATNNAPIEFVYKRENGVISLQYFYNGTSSNKTTMFNQNNWTLNQPFANNVVFGGYIDSNGNPGRFFKGTLSDMIIIMDEN